KLRLRKGLYDKLAFDVDGKRFTAPPGASLHQRSFNRLVVKSGGKEIKTGERSDGAVKMLAKNGAFLFYHKNLWQMYPKKLEANAPKGELTIAYWPKEAGIHSYEPVEEYMIPSSSSPEACGTGASRTQEMVLDFSNSVGVAEAKNVYGEPVVATTPPKWIQKTKVVGNLQPYDMSVAPVTEEFINKYIDFVLRNREFFRFYGQWEYGTVHNVFNIRDYKWLVVGRYANIGNEEDILQAPWLLYMRSGDRKYLKFATLWTRHLMEVQSIRWHDLYPKCVGMSRRHHYTAWLGNGDYGHTMLCQYLEYYHCTGYRPAWKMAEMTALAMADTKKDASWRYLSNPIVGNIRMYLETGDDKYKKVADEFWTRLCDFDRSSWFGGSHGGRMVRWYAPLNKNCMKAWR
ncbi:MAG: hypothetical protein KAG97_08850, partial [Victivallales bacterium]|nr:hypothetical protein [Victivallales bacterium]